VRVGIAHAVTGLIAAVVVLAALGAGFRYLAGRAFGRAPGMPRLRVPGRRGLVAVSRALTLGTGTAQTQPEPPGSG
jgi:hypothetical protein